MYKSLNSAWKPKNGGIKKNFFKKNGGFYEIRDRLIYMSFIKKTRQKKFKIFDFY